MKSLLLALALLSPASIVPRETKPLPTWRVKRPYLLDERSIIILDGKRVTPDVFHAAQPTIKEFEIKGRRIIKIIAVTEGN